MQIAVVTLFPQMFEAISAYGITGRAIKKGLIKLDCLNPRDFTTDKHRTVDDKPFGGGPGMLMKTEPLVKAIQAARESLQPDTVANKVVYLSPQGRRLDQNGVAELAENPHLVLVCGRYQGVDQRVLEAEIDEEWSVGDYVISGGELAAMVLIDAMTRLQPGALGAEDSATSDSFAGGLLHSPQYTRPQTVGGKGVPDILLSGDHEQIRLWQMKQSLGATWKKRPDLLEQIEFNTEQRALLQEYIQEYIDEHGSVDQASDGEGSGVEK